MDPYQQHLKALHGHDIKVVVSRANASDVKGTIVSVAEEGCIIKASDKRDNAGNTFIAYRDIRGVRDDGWDMDVIAN